MPPFYPQGSLSKDEIKALAKAVHDEIYSIESTLKRRGFIYAGEGRKENLILPSSQNDMDGFFQHMASRTFRNILKEMVKKKRDIRQNDFEAECNLAKLQEYFDFLERSGILNKESPSSFCLALNINDFGYTLEWYVAELFKRELGCTAAWGVRVKDIREGGDLDVLARVEGELAYVETKSASPKDITEAEIRHFLQRDQHFDPDISVFLVDTRDDLSGLVTRFEGIITLVEVKDGADPNRRHKIEKLADFGGIYFTLRRIFIIHSKPSILTNLRRCLNYYFTILPHVTYFSREKRMNFTSDD